MKNNISDKDKKDWEEFLSSDEKLPNKDLKFKKKKIVKIKHIDLHGFTLEQANITIKKFMTNLKNLYKKEVKGVILLK